MPPEFLANGNRKIIHHFFFNREIVQPVIAPVEFPNSLCDPLLYECHFTPTNTGLQSPSSSS